MRRLGFVVFSTEIGGMERYLLRLLRLLPQDIKVTVFVRSGQRGALHDDYTRTGARLIYGGFGYANPIRMFRLYQQILKAKLDGITDLTGVFSGSTLALARLAGVKRRVAFHRRSTFAFKQSLLRRVFAQVSIWLIEKSATAILANSCAALQRFHAAALTSDDPRLQVIPNILPPDDLVPIRSRAAVRENLGIDHLAPVLLHIGRFDPAKDHRTLIRAASEVLHKCSRAHAIIAGPSTDVLPAEILGPFSGIESKRIHLLGARSDVADLLSASDVFVFTSVTEGQPNALLEAMASGLPIVASDIPAIREIVPERGWQLLVRAGDASGFAAAAIACLTEPSLRHAHCYRAETLRLTNPDRIMAQLLTIMLPKTHHA